MRVFIVSIGTFGDIKPSLSVALRLKDKVDYLVFGSTPDNKGIIEKNGIKFQSLGNSMQQLINGFLTFKLKNFHDFILQQFDDTLKFFEKEKFDLILGHVLFFPGLTISQLHNTRYKIIALLPHIYRSKYYPPIMVPFVNLAHILNQLFWLGMMPVFNLLFLKPINIYRKKIGLPRLRHFMQNQEPVEAIIPIDKAILTIPEDIQKKHKYVQLPYWYDRDADQHLGQLNDDLKKFLQTDEKVIYIGFGSGSYTINTKRKADQFTNMISDVLDKTNWNLIVARAFCQLINIKENKRLKFIDSVSHSELFPLVDVVVHHGGIGTINIACRSGVAQVVKPFATDQYFWGNQVFKQKLGSRPLKNFDSKNFINAVKYALFNNGVQENVKKVKQEVLASNGIDDFIRLFENGIIAS